MGNKLKNREQKGGKEGAKNGKKTSFYRNLNISHLSLRDHLQRFESSGALQVNCNLCVHRVIEQK